MQKDLSRNPVAYEYYLRGLSAPLTNEGHRMAAGMLQTAIDLDSTYSPSFTELAYRFRMLGLYGEEGKVYALNAVRYLNKALSLNSTSLRALVALSSAYNESGKTEEAFTLVQKALLINPNDPTSRFALGYIYRYVGLLDEAEREQVRALELSPGNPRFRTLGLTYKYQGKYENALSAFELDRGTPWSLMSSSEIFRRTGKRELAIAFADSVLKIGEDDQKLAAQFELAYWSGQRALALEALRKRESQDPADEEVLYSIVERYGIIGEAGDCARCLRKSVELGFFCYPYMARDPDLDPVRSAPEVQKVLALAKTKHEEFKRKWGGALP
jgi:tetratricopeptide (TPR) repeat protein